MGRTRLHASDKALIRQRLKVTEHSLHRSHNHMSDFLQAMRTRRDPVCPVEVGHRSNTVCVIIHIAMKLGRMLRWDPAAERFLGDSEANALLDYPHREPWVV